MDKVKICNSLFSSGNTTVSLYNVFFLWLISSFQIHVPESFSHAGTTDILSFPNDGFVYSYLLTDRQRSFAWDSRLINWFAFFSIVSTVNKLWKPVLKMGHTILISAVNHRYRNILSHSVNFFLFCQSKNKANVKMNSHEN